MSKTKPIAGVIPIRSLVGTTGTFTGICRVASLAAEPRCWAPPFHRAALVDASGALTCYGWPGEFAVNGQPEPLDIVEVSGVARVFNGKVIADLKTMSLVTTTVDSNVALELLPVTAAPVPTLIPRLVSAVSQISDPHLRRFVLSVLAEREVAENFLRVPGSCGFHHAEPGGLLQHSLEVVEPILVWPGLDQETRDLAAAAALFHDIGKIRTIKPDGGSTELGGLVSHESLNLVICEPALRALEIAWRNGCYAIMHILTAGMGRYAYDRKMLASHLVGVADRVSSEGSAQSLAFAKAEDWRRFVRHDGKTYWRVASNR
jgi:3'-5' exoribonuclease